MLAHPLGPKLKELRLSGMLQSLEERAELAREQQLSPVEFLALLIEDELERRHQPLSPSGRGGGWKPSHAPRRAARRRPASSTSKPSPTSTSPQCPRSIGPWCWTWPPAALSRPRRTG